MKLFLKRTLISALMLGTVSATETNQSLPKVLLQAARNTSLGNEVQHALDKGLVWLEKTQDPNGFWSTADHPAITALALAALRFPPSDREQKAKPPGGKKGYAWLLGCVQPDGGIYRKELPSY